MKEQLEQLKKAMSDLDANNMKPNTGFIGILVSEENDLSAMAVKGEFASLAAALATGFASNPKFLELVKFSLEAYESFKDDVKDFESNNN